MDNDRQAGFTILEMLLALTLLVLIAVAVANTIKIPFQAQATTAATLSEIQQSRLLINKIFDELRLSKIIIPSSDKTSLTYRLPYDTTDRKFFMGNDHLLYNQLGSKVKLVTRRTAKEVRFSYNPDDPKGETLDVIITFPDSSTLSTTVKALNIGVEEE